MQLIATGLSCKSKGRTLPVELATPTFFVHVLYHVEVA